MAYIELIGFYTFTTFRHQLQRIRACTTDTAMVDHMVGCAAETDTQLGTRTHVSHAPTLRDTQRVRQESREHRGTAGSHLPVATTCNTCHQTTNLNGWPKMIASFESSDACLLHLPGSAAANNNPSQSSCATAATDSASRTTSLPLRIQLAHPSKYSSPLITCKAVRYCHFNGAVWDRIYDCLLHRLLIWHTCVCHQHCSRTNHQLTDVRRHGCGHL